jgi:hypothetical protein
MIRNTVFGQRSAKELKSKLTCHREQYLKQMLHTLYFSYFRKRIIDIQSPTETLAELLSFFRT